MANETTTTSLDDLQQSLIAEATIVMSQGATLPDFFTKRTLQPGQKGVTFPVYGNITAAAVAEGTSLTNTQVSTSSTTVTPTEAGVLMTATDMALENSTERQLGTDLGANAGAALRDLRNQTAYALFDSFTATVGTTNTDVSEANILKAVRILMAAKAPRPYYFPVTPHVYEDLLTLYGLNTNFAPNSIRNSVMESGILPMIYGVIPILVDNLAAGTSAGEADQADTKSAIFSPAAIGWVDGYELRTETERDVALRATKIAVTSKYAGAIIQNSFGVEFLLDNKD